MVTLIESNVSYHFIEEERNLLDRSNTGMYEDHLKTCDYCNKGLKAKPTIRVKSASTADKRRKLIELGHMI